MASGPYYVAGKRVPSVTTITGQLGWSKEALKRWAWKVGHEGKTLDDAMRGPQDAGTLAHAAIEADIRGETLDLSKVDEAMRATVDKIVARWRAWRDRTVDVVLLSEAELTSPSMLYGGRLDLLFRGKDGRIWLADLKTGGLYAEHLVQVAAYAMLVEENSWESREAVRSVDVLALLRIPRDSDTIVTLERPFDRKGIEVETFRLCRRLHRIQKQLEAEV